MRAYYQLLELRDRVWNESQDACMRACYQSLEMRDIGDSHIVTNYRIHACAHGTNCPHPAEVSDAVTHPLDSCLQWWPHSSYHTTLPETKMMSSWKM